MSPTPRHRLPDPADRQSMRRPRIAENSRRNKLRIAFAVSAVAAVTGAVAPFAIGSLAGSSAGADSLHHASHVRVVDQQSQATRQRVSKAPATHVASRACAGSSTKPSTLWNSSYAPQITSSTVDNPTMLGVDVVPSKSGTITGLAFWKGAGNTGTHTASLSSDGKQLATGTFSNESASGWQWLTLAHPVAVKAGQDIVASYVAPHGHFAYTPNTFAHGAICSGGLRAVSGFQRSVSTKGVEPAANRSSHVRRAGDRDNNYFVDVRFAPGGTATPTQSPTAPDPTVVTTTPSPTSKPTAPPTKQSTAPPTKEPTSTPTKEPTSSPTGGTTSSGWPNASNTGVPAGTKLTPSKSISVTKDGTVISGLDVSGDITVRANNVTIEKTKVTGGHIDLGWDQHGIMITDVEVDGLGKAPADQRVPAIGSNGYTCIRCNVHGSNSGFDVRNDVTIKDSWAHDIGPASGVHKTAVGSNGADHVVIQHNVLSCEVSGCSAAIAFYGDFTPVNDVVVDGNLFNTAGSYCSYEGTLSGKAYPNATNIKWTNNHYGTQFHPTCGIYGPADGWGSQGGNVWSGNVWDGTNKAISAG